MWFDVLFLAMLCHSLSPAPPLTLENVLKEVKGVDGEDLYEWLNPTHGIPIDISTEEAVEKFLQGRCHYQPSWRALIFALDVGGKTNRANRIMHYAEPVQAPGRYMLCD